ncbi:DUF3318 domain-containing protein [Polaromonas sp. A23]|uniref:DUF3318 domain-containing protein n=1 Tax=Polaromonas sp. A23 TaxID=1944133 RepID=UPI0009871AF9|nr:DUF3318 domain-containing protein [Polaromonas sp. A23]OOG41131.1 hypothetical protein B0B52_12380 [Polaromonas sp. A23]
MTEATNQRALRKQLLLMRSATERAELVQAMQATRQSTSVFTKGISGLAVGKGLPLVLGLLKRAPLISPVLSLVLSGARRPLLRYALLGTGAALLVWKGYQWLAEQRASDMVPADEDDVAPRQ